MKRFLGFVLAAFVAAPAFGDGLSFPFLSQGSVTDTTANLAVKPSVCCVATSNLTLSGEQTIDGQLTSGSYVLLSGQTAPAENGPWLTAAGAWTRPTWYAAGLSPPQFTTIFIRLGSTYQGTTWKMTTAGVVVDTSAETWTITPYTLNASTTNTSPTFTGTTTAANFTDTGNSIFGDASGDTITFNTGAWSLGNNLTNTSAAGALAAGSNSLVTWNSSFTGDAGGTSTAFNNVLSSTASGANAFSTVRGAQDSVIHAGSALITSLAANASFVQLTSTGNATNAPANNATFTLSNTGSITGTATAYSAGAPTLSSTGSIGTILGFNSGDLGHATLVTNAIGFRANDLTASVTEATGFKSLVTSGTGKWSFRDTGGANNAFAGNVRIGSGTVVPTVALDVTGAGLFSTTLGVTNDLSIGANAGTARNIFINSAAANVRSVTFQTAGVARWITGAGSSAEGGSDAGSSYFVQAETDAGALIDNPIVILRAAGGAMSLSRPITQTSASATAFQTGPNGATNPVFKVVNSTASQASGLSITGNATGVASVIQAIDSGTNSGITLAAKGNGKVLLSTTGTIEANSTIQADGVINVGTNGSTNGSVNLLGSTSGTLSVTTAAAAGTYNFILPTTAGSSGNLLQSGGGGATAMTWNTGKTVQAFTLSYDPVSLAAASVRTDTQTVTGITTAGGAVSWNPGSASDPFPLGCLVQGVYASAADTVKIMWMNSNTVSACDVASSTWKFSQAQ